MPVLGDEAGVHGIRNLLAVAIANVEGIIDGKLDAAQRMAPLLETLRAVNRLIDGKVSSQS